MKLSLTPPVDPIAIRERNQLGRSAPGLSPEEVARSLSAALTELGIPNRCFCHKAGFGDGHDQWDVTVQGPIHDELLKIEQDRLATMSQRSRDEFAKKTVNYGVFVYGRRDNGSCPWQPCEVNIYYTIKRRTLTAFRKHLFRAIDVRSSNTPPTP